MCEACGPLAVLSRPTSMAPTPLRAGQRTRRHRATARLTASTGFADLVISGGTVITMDARQPRVESVAVRNGKIVAVGSTEELAGSIGPDTEQLDLDGRTLLPGLIDPHMHFVMVQMADWVDISPMATPTESDIFATLRVAAPTSTGWVLAKKFDPSITAGHPRLERDVLDRLVPDLPLLILESNGHIAWANSEAFRRAGVGRDTPNPPTARYTRDADANSPAGSKKPLHWRRSPRVSRTSVGRR